MFCQGDSYVVNMDVHYLSGDNRSSETLFITSQYTPAGYGFNSIRLIAYERRSVYSVYRGCGDGPSTESLCICSSANKNPLLESDNWLKFPRTSSQLVSEQESHKLNDCIYIIQYHITGTPNTRYSLYSINICDKIPYQIDVQVLGKVHLSVSTIATESLILLPKDVKFLAVLQQHASKPSRLFSLLHFEFEMIVIT